MLQKPGPDSNSNTPDPSGGVKASLSMQRSRRLTLPAIRTAQSNGFYQSLSVDPFDDVAFVAKYESAKPDVTFALIQSAARRLGDAWVDDTANFSDVTVKTSRLQTLLASQRRKLPPLATGPAIAVVVQPWDDHVLGAALLEARLHHAGFATELILSYDNEPLAQFDAIFVSATNTERLEELAHQVAMLREHAGANTPIIVGGRAATKMEKIDGADLISSSLIDALEHCAKQTRSTRFLI